MKHQGAKKILVIEDEKPMARALQLKLTRGGFKTAVVYDGESAHDFLNKEKFDLIILDLVMPRVDGFALLRDLRAKKIETPVIVVSNLSQEEDIERAKALGVKEYFVKTDTPINYIVERVEQMLE